MPASPVSPASDQHPVRPSRAQLRWWFGRHLYLRIWLAVVLGVALLMTVVGWAWRASVEHTAAHLPHREWVVRDAQGQVLAKTSARPTPGNMLALQVPLGPEGQTVQLYLERRIEPAPGAVAAPATATPTAPSATDPSALPPERPRPLQMLRPPAPPLARELAPWWARPPYGFVWLLGLMGLATALALYPVVRRLTKRLEVLQQGVQRWGDGDLSVRVPQQGNDEVADLSRRFNAAAQRIEHLMAAQKSLLANASHELRSPLARIRMGLELLDAPAAATPVHERTRQEILRNMAELDLLIDEILLASRLDAHEADMGTVEAVDLLGLCAEECARVGASLELPNLPAGQTHLEVRGVTKLLRRMVRNLLENAMRYGAGVGTGESAGTVGGGGADQAAPEAVVLTLYTGAQGPETAAGAAKAASAGVLLRVCDRGPGVPLAYRERIFEPFFRLPGASEQAGGVGLGLSLVKSIAQRHGWAVRCEDCPGGGACFVVSAGGERQSRP